MSQAVLPMPMPTAQHNSAPLSASAAATQTATALTVLGKKPTRNPGYTALNMFGRSIRDIPHYGYLPYRIWPKRGKIRADSLADWCGKRFLQSKSRNGKALFRINTYKHANGKRYVDCVYFVNLADDDLVQLKLLFGDFIDKKVVRSGLLRRPRLKPEERKELDSIVADYYKVCYERREERIRETGKAY